MRLGVDPLSVSVKLVDAAAFPKDAAGQAGPFLVGQCWSSELLSEVKLAVEEPPAERVVILHHLGLEDELVAEVAWEDMDRSVEVDHLTSLWIPVLASPVASELVGLVELARVLRRHCPWDVAQTHQSLARHMREEAYELIDALARLGPEGQGDAELEEELGDVLYQVVFHCQIAAEEGRFNLADVARRLSDKLVGRHPHVFGTTVAADSDRVALNWEQIKKKEKGRASAMDGIIPELPALSLAQAVQRRSKGIAGVEPPALSSSGEDEAGLLLWEAAARATTQGIDAEDALRRVALAWLRAYKDRELGKLESAGGGAAGSVGASGPDDGD
jgi:tetrapyrrole methylase family protein / MazG family protein